MLLVNYRGRTVSRIISVALNESVDTIDSVFTHSRPFCKCFFACVDTATEEAKTKRNGSERRTIAKRPVPLPRSKELNVIISTVLSIKHAHTAAHGRYQSDHIRSTGAISCDVDETACGGRRTSKRRWKFTETSRVILWQKCRIRVPRTFTNINGI